MWFDVAVGPWPYIPPKTPEDYARMWARLNQKRIDVVLDFGTFVAIVELRWDASASAIGRLMMYRDLLKDDDPFGKPVQLYLVTNKVDPLWAPTARSVGVQVIAVDVQ